MVRRGNSLLHPDSIRVTPEFKNLLRFLEKHPNIEEWPNNIKFASTSIIRLQATDIDALKAALTDGEGHPVIVTDATSDWKAASTWNLAYFREKGHSTVVRVNDRAPARHADDADVGGPQQSISLRLAEYLDYIEQLPESLDKYEPEKSSTPFYLNGWRAFHDIPTLAEDCPPIPEFATPLDDTLALLAAVDVQLFKASATGETAAWCHQVKDNLRKVFVSPPGCITRLHYDAGDAHGWLAQIAGRKLFVLLPPSDTKYMHVLASEKETAQSPIDPLRPDVQRWPEYRQTSPIACILNPGEAVVIPKGWWHYAVSLDRSITVQTNFYHAQSNANGLVNMVLKTAEALKTAQSQQN